MSHWVFISALLAFLSLDTTAVGQFMVSRPIVVGPLVGWLLGHPNIGLEMGALIEMIWIGDLPVGAHLPLDLTMLSGVSVALACELAGNPFPRDAVTTYALAVTIPLAVLSTEVTILVNKFNVRWVHLAQRMALGGRFRTFDGINWLVVAELFVKGFLVAAACLTLAHFTSGLLNLSATVLNGRVMEGLYYAHWLLLALGCSAIIDLLVEKKNLFYLILSIAAIMSLAIFGQMKGVYLVCVALCVGFSAVLLFAGKEETND
jgi:mannose/fructose/N-acetylgalactosamine-specific phosphotransferase system component IIC